MGKLALLLFLRFWIKTWNKYNLDEKSFLMVNPHHFSWFSDMILPHDSFRQRHRLNKVLFFLREDRTSYSSYSFFRFLKRIWLLFHLRLAKSCFFSFSVVRVSLFVSLPNRILDGVLLVLHVTYCLFDTTPCSSRHFVWNFGKEIASINKNDWGKKRRNKRQIEKKHADFLFLFLHLNISSFEISSYEKFCLNRKTSRTQTQIRIFSSNMYFKNRFP